MRPTVFCESDLQIINQQVVKKTGNLREGNVKKYFWGYNAPGNERR